MAVAFALNLLIAISLAGRAAADEGDDFSNNLFTDLAPLLALFGERVTMQFMSQSMGWADNFILAMAPLGIVTAIVSAIRVGGPSWLKAIIGRARENLAVAETDIMSSTSKEVCELWNGQAVVRCMGTAPISDFIILMPKVGIKPFAKVKVMDLKEAMEERHLEELNNWDAITHGTPENSLERGDSGAKSPSPEIIITRNTVADAPNISLNSHRRFSRHELRIVAVLGTVIQLGVLTYAALATYYPPWRFLKSGQRVAKYAFPCTAAGTVILVTGMLLCSHVVESSTAEKAYRAPQGKGARMVWLQKEKTVADQVFDSFAIFAEGNQDIVLASERANKPASKNHQQNHMQNHNILLELKTLLGTAISLCGFIVQFIGFRGMHWSISVTQLGAILVMTALRAWVRRGLANPPQCQRLSAGFELDWLARTLDDVVEAPWYIDATANRNTEKATPSTKNWTIVTGVDRSYIHLAPGGGGSVLSQKIQLPSLENAESTEIEDHAASSSAQRVLMIRRDLGELAGWSGPASAEAIALASAIEITMNTLFSHMSEESLVWTLEASYRSTNAQIIYLRLERENSEEKAWKAFSDEIDAVLSLWLSSVNEHERDWKTNGRKDDGWLRAKGSPVKRSLRLLGSDKPELRRDLASWMPQDTSRVMLVEECWDSTSRSFTTDRIDLKVENYSIVGFGSRVPIKLQSATSTGFKRLKLNKFDLYPDNAEEKVIMVGNPWVLLATETFSSLNLLYAQDMFSSFLRAVAKTLERPINGTADIRIAESSGADAWKLFTLQNENLTKLAQDIQTTGLGSLEDIYLSLIPPLSAEHKLPSPDAIINLARHHARPYEQQARWEEASGAYLWLFRTTSTFPCDSEIYIRGTAVFLEHLRRMTLAVELQQHKYNPSGQGSLEALKKRLDKELKSVLMEVVTGILRLHEKQGRGWECSFPVKPTPEEQDTEHKGPDTLQLARIHRLALSGTDAQVEEELRDGHIGRKANARDITDWTPLHYAVARGDGAIAGTLLRYQADVNARDLFEWTPFHYACQGGPIQSIRDLISNGADVDARGRDGIAPLHCAAKRGDVEVVALLVERGAAIDVLDASGNSPLLWASFTGYKDVFSYLWSRANRRLQDRSGKSVLHLAAMGGNVEVGKEVLEIIDTEAKDRHGLTPLLIAVRSGREAFVRLLIEAGADIKAKDNRGLGAIHWDSEGAMLNTLIELRAQIDLQDLQGQTSLHIAARDNISTTRKLIELGADKEIRTDGGKTALHHAVEGGNEDIMRMLIEHGSVIEAKDNDGRTPLHHATSQGNEGIMTLLVKHGSDIEAKDNDGRTPLHYATSQGNEVIIRLLVKHGSDIEAKDNRGRTPLHHATSQGNEGIMTLLVEHGSDIEAKDNRGRTPLHHATFRGNEGIMRLLIQHGSDIEAKDNRGRTPLHHATLQEREGIMKLLVQHGSDIEAKDKRGWTPLHHATFLQNESVVRRLAELGADLNARDQDGRKPLHIAVFHNESSLLRSVFLELGADDDVEHNRGAPLGSQF